MLKLLFLLLCVLGLTQGLTIYVLPHSHDDVSWLTTFEVLQAQRLYHVDEILILVEVFEADGSGSVAEGRQSRQQKGSNREIHSPPILEKENQKMALWTFSAPRL